MGLGEFCLWLLWAFCGGFWAGDLLNRRRVRLMREAMDASDAFADRLLEERLEKIGKEPDRG